MWIGGNYSEVGGGRWSWVFLTVVVVIIDHLHCGDQTSFCPWWKSQMNLTVVMIRDDSHREDDH